LNVRRPSSDGVCVAPRSSPAKSWPCGASWFGHHRSRHRPPLDCTAHLQNVECPDRQERRSVHPDQTPSTRPVIEGLVRDLFIPGDMMSRCCSVDLFRCESITPADCFNLALGQHGLADGRPCHFVMCPPARASSRPRPIPTAPFFRNNDHFFSASTEIPADAQKTQPACFAPKPSLASNLPPTVTIQITEISTLFRAYAARRGNTLTKVAQPLPPVRARPG
jgi:hypothetical protein